LIGLGEVFASIGQLEFFYDQAPDGMRSIGTALFSATTALGAYLGTFLINMTTKYAVRHGHQAWINNFLSLGHMDYYFWLLAILSGINFIVFLYFAHIYQYKVDMESTMRKKLLQISALDAEGVERRATEGVSKGEQNGLKA